MTNLGRLGLCCSTSAILVLGMIGACSSNSGDSNFAVNGGSANKGGASGNAGTSTATSGSTSIVTGDAGGIFEPDSSVVEDVDTYTTSCAAEVCADGEACFETCSWGSCCVHACPGQGPEACCDRQGGSVPGAICTQ